MWRAVEGYEDANHHSVVLVTTYTISVDLYLVGIGKCAPPLVLDLSFSQVHSGQQECSSASAQIEASRAADDYLADAAHESAHHANDGFRGVNTELFLRLGSK